jgi:hypothetical protein
MAEKQERYTLVEPRTRVIYAMTVVAVVAATAPGASALFYGWGLHDKVRFILAIIASLGAAQLVALRLGVAHVRGVATLCPAWLKTSVGTAVLLGVVATFVAAGLLSLLGPYDLAAPGVGWLAAIGYLVCARHTQATNP